MSGNEDEEEFFDDDDDAHDEYVHRKTVIIGSNIRRHRKKEDFLLRTSHRMSDFQRHILGLSNAETAAQALKLFLNFVKFSASHRMSLWSLSRAA
jgi:hypothetical protein